VQRTCHRSRKHAAAPSKRAQFLFHGRDICAFDSCERLRNGGWALVSPPRRRRRISGVVFGTWRLGSAHSIQALALATCALPAFRFAGSELLARLMVAGRRVRRGMQRAPLFVDANRYGKSSNSRCGQSKLLSFGGRVSAR